MWVSLQEQLDQLPQFLGGHLLLSTSALLIGILVSIPLGILSSRSKRLNAIVLPIAGLIQTIPSIALLALMVLILSGRVGFLPAFLALSLYSVLPILRNTVTGITQIDPAMVEAATSLGMTDWQRLTRIELPLAAPVIFAGIRTSTIWVVGTTTLSTPVGAPSLGNYIFSGLQTRNSVSVIFGCVFVALLTILLDQLIRLAEQAARERRKPLAWISGLGLLAVLIGGLTPMTIKLIASSTMVSQFSEQVSRPESGSQQARLAGMNFTVGAKAFTEQFVLSELLKNHLEMNGAAIEMIQNMGSTILFDALRNNQVDIYVDYSGTIWATIMKRSDTIERNAMFIEVASYLKEKYGVLVLGRLGFENAYGFVMRRDQVRRLGIRSISDLVAHSDRLSIGSDLEFFSRPEWIQVRDVYGLSSLSTRSMDSTFLYDAIKDEKLDIISANTTDGRIAAYDLIVLRDPAQALPPYDAILLLSPQAARNNDLIDTLMPLLNRIDVEEMRAANRIVDLDGGSPRQAATFLLCAATGELCSD